VGHTGTLDPFATGLLVALVGGATRAARFFNGLPKRYVATFAFGSQTDTDDLTGEVIARTELPSAARIHDEIDRFRGVVEQLPPDYSAVHVDGKRAHELARAGKRPELRTRTVTVHELSVVNVVEIDGLVSTIDVEIACSAGTYVRSIARDLGRATGSAAHVTALRRTGVGPFGLDRSVVPEQLTIERDLFDLAVILPHLGGFRSVAVSDEIARRVGMGHAMDTATLGIDADAGDDRRLILVAHGVAIAVATLVDGLIDYDMVLRTEIPA
jgi:tRNA pseudouridine55 synthase